MSKRVLSEEVFDREILLLDLPAELILKIFNSFDQSELTTILSLILLNKDGFTLVRPWCKEFLERTFLQDIMTPFSLTKILQRIKHNESYFNRENVFLLLRIITIIGESPFLRYHYQRRENFPIRPDNKVCLNGVALLDRKDHSLTPLLKTPGLSIETYKLENKKTPEEMSDTQFYAYMHCGKRHRAMTYDINRSSAIIIPVDPEKTPVNKLLLNREHILSERKRDLKELLIRSEELRGKSLIEFYVRENISLYQKQCCKILNIPYICVYCDYHDKDDCCNTYE